MLAVDPQRLARQVFRNIRFDPTCGLLHEVFVKLEAAGHTSVSFSNDDRGPTAREGIKNHPTLRACGLDEERGQSFRHRSGMGDTMMLIVSLRNAHDIPWVCATKKVCFRSVATKARCGVSATVSVKLASRDFGRVGAVRNPDGIQVEVRL